ncbi:Bifunctional protein HldE [Gemmata sp. SH-PL17]|nr:Bifunctional protein HldE [Gemmata sp. SH-PL17]
MLSERIPSGERPPVPRRKVIDLQELTALLPPLRAGGRKVVLCHGAFDPLHAGHIRHFQQARELGHILIVTVTPDRFVSAGPPAFREDVRAESIAALECVDFVAVNKWPMAVECIQALRPDVFVKGPDLVPECAAPEEQAIAAVGGTVASTATALGTADLTPQFPTLSRAANEYLAGFAGRYGPETVLRYLDGIRPLKVLIVGETIIDEYHYCEAIGKASKEPTLAVKSLSVEQFAGGVLATANHLANFCGDVSLVSMLGEQNSHERFVGGALNPGIKTRFVRRPGAPTIVKRRFVEQYFFTKLFEVYEINDSHLSEADSAAVCRELRQRVGEFDAVLVFDFGHEMLGPEAVRVLCDEARFLAVNTQSNAGNFGYHTASKYPRADYVCITEGELRLDSRDRRGDLRHMIDALVRRTGCGAVSVTRGARGCLCYSPTDGFTEVPAFAGKIVDRVGAGDAFLTLAAPCVVQGAPVEVAGFLGNVAGAQAVATVCNRSPIERDSLVRYVRHLLK